MLNTTNRPAQSSNEQPHQPDSCISQAASLLQSLQSSPIFDDDYRLTTSNLCQAIITIADTIGELMDDVMVSLKEKRTISVHYLDWTKERIWQIRSLAELVDSRLEHKDYEKLHEVMINACL
jgi:hypothetical protein